VLSLTCWGSSPADRGKKMKFTIRRVLFAVITTPLVLGAYALVLMVLGGSPSMFLDAMWSVAIGYVVGLPVAVAVANRLAVA
jgi:hypothetical protein